MSALSKYKTYPEYKDSGVEWLGEIPKDWELWKLAHAYEEIGSGTTPPSSSDEWFANGTIPWVTTGELRENIIHKTFKNLTKKAQQTFSTLKIYPSNSVVIAMYGATIGRLGILGISATTNQACCVMTKSKYINNKYLFYWLYAFKQDIINLSSGGGQPNINQEKVASLKVSLPIRQEQTKIAQFLDYETAKIDQLIEKQQKLIELLKEKRQAVISHAVTKGLDPNVKMKDSGVEWLGEVPEHWDVKALKYIFTLNPSKSELSDNQLKEVCSFVPMDKLKLNSLELDETRIIKDVYNGYTYFKNLDLLMAKVTPCFENKNMVVARNLTNEIGFGSTEIYVMRMQPYYSPQYLYYRLQENTFGYLAISNMSGAGGLKRVPSEFINSYLVAIPDLQEQMKIVTYLDNVIKKFEILTHKAEQQIELMKERRTALISAAVTGKIDVRDWQAPN